ncbi:hypothetical protein AB0E63_40110 [Kribbella sp. NPDC026596]|uniref:hypothetical protein n=1 Tax=Kribbella sp. NPDC026596 TaxID=3155122 RepID=UPI003403D30D
MTELLNPAQWRRAGRGRRREFPALEAEQVAALLGELPPEFAPYRLIMHDLVPGPGRHVSVARPIDPAQIASFIGDGHWLYFIVSERLSPELVANLPDVDSATLSINGAINLQIGARNRRGPEPPSLGIVTQVATRSGDSRTHDDYDKIYDAAVRTIRKLGS